MDSRNGESISRGSVKRLSMALGCASAMVVLGSLSGQAAPVQQYPGAIVLPPEQVDDPALRCSWGNLLIGAQEQESVIIVTGQARVEAESDRARIYFAVETERATAREAGEANADRITAVAAAVRSAGQAADRLRVQTSSYSLNPVYGPVAPNRPREIVGYMARNTLQVRVDEVDRVGSLIDAALAAGSNRVSSLRFEVRDPEPYRNEALREAIRGARGEAEIMAESLGMTLAPPLEVQGGAELPNPRPFLQSGAERAFAVADAAPTPIEAGLQTISARVTIRFRLDPTP